MALDLKHQSLTQFAARLRERYRNASGDEAARIARFIITGLLAGNFTDTQVRNAFGLTTLQYTTLKAKWQLLSDDLAAVRAAQGE